MDKTSIEKRYINNKSNINTSTILVTYWLSIYLKHKRMIEETYNKVRVKDIMILIIFINKDPILNLFKEFCQ